MSRRWSAPTCLLVMALAGCGGAAGRGAQSPESAAPREPQGGIPVSATPTTKDERFKAQPGAPPPPAAQGAAAPSSEAAPEEERGSVAEARRRWEMAARELDGASRSCAEACRALASLERATTHLCEVAATAGQPTRCTDAQARLRVARDKVRSSCTTCP